MVLDLLYVVRQLWGTLIALIKNDCLIIWCFYKNKSVKIYVVLPKKDDTKRIAQYIAERLLFSNLVLIPC